MKDDDIIEMFAFLYVAAHSDAAGKALREEMARHILLVESLRLAEDTTP